MAGQPPWLKSKGKSNLLDDPEDRAEAKAGHPPTAREEAQEDSGKSAKKQAISNLMARAKKGGGK
jgi:hypothetical protein